MSVMILSFHGVFYKPYSVCCRHQLYNNRARASWTARNSCRSTFPSPSSSSSSSASGTRTDALPSALICGKMKCLNSCFVRICNHIHVKERQKYVIGFVRQFHATSFPSPSACVHRLRSRFHLWSLCLSCSPRGLMMALKSIGLENDNLILTSAVQSQPQKIGIIQKRLIRQHLRNV